MAKLLKKSLDGNMETLLLAILAEGPNYGYQIVQELNTRGQGLLQMGEGTVYPVLHRMEERGLIAGRWRKAANGRQRKYYHVTPRGRRAFNTNRQQWQALTTLMRSVLEPQPSTAEINGANS